jgi:hypothetical protein
MKLSVSVPDDLWAQVHPEGAGPSETVQRGLRTLAEELRRAKRPLANAPDQANLDRYREAFDSAVETTTRTIQAALDNGYRLGLLLAPGLVASDFDALELPRAVAGLQTVVASWGEDDGDVYSHEFTWSVTTALDNLKGPDSGAETRARLQEILGEEDAPGPGVRWRQEGEEVLPELSDTFARGALAALRDVRDEATRRMWTSMPAEEQP